MQKHTGHQLCFLARLYLKMQSKIYDFLPSPSYFCTSGLTDHHHHRRRFCEPVLGRTNCPLSLSFTLSLSDRRTALSPFPPSFLHKCGHFLLPASVSHRSLSPIPSIRVIFLEGGCTHNENGCGAGTFAQKRQRRGSRSLAEWQFRVRLTD